MFRRALLARRGHGGGVVRTPVIFLIAGSLVLGVTACGGGSKLDANEPSGDYTVRVLKHQFPAQQKLAKTSDVEIQVENAGNKTIPNIAVTFGRNTKAGRVETLDKRLADPQLADPNRPVFVVNGRPRNIGGLPESQDRVPSGAATAYVDTYALGKLEPGKIATFRWNVTAVRAGPFKVAWTVSAGLNGKAKAVLPDGAVPTGVFTGNISNVAPKATVSEKDGKTIIIEQPQTSTGAK
jgi:hypothetical protein